MLCVRRQADGSIARDVITIRVGLYGVKSPAYLSGRNSTAVTRPTMFRTAGLQGLQVTKTRSAGRRMPHVTRPALASR